MYEMGRTYLEFVRQLHLQKSIIGVLENGLYLITHLDAHAIISVSGTWSAPPHATPLVLALHLPFA